MNTVPFTPPAYGVAQFNCPHCKAFSSQNWFPIGNGEIGAVPDMSQCVCRHCREVSLWVDDKLVYPDSSTAPLANSDLPSAAQADYDEARSILSRSPRGAAALLRLVIQKLCKHLGEAGKDINADIKSLVAKGLSPKLQKALDLVRVVGNNAVHPGTIDLNDTPEIAHRLFVLVNIIVDLMISQPKQIDEFYTDVMPPSALEGIAKRDGK